MAIHPCKMAHFGKSRLALMLQILHAYRPSTQQLDYIFIQLRILLASFSSLAAFKARTMKSFWILICLLEWSVWSIALLQVEVTMGAEKEKSDVYIVYMGALPADSSADVLRESHFQLLASVLPRGKHLGKALIRSYKHGFSGFAARLSKEEALAIRNRAGVVSVFQDPIYQLHTTRSWEFLQQTSVELDANVEDLESSSSSSPLSDTIIGLLDTGIWPESESFSDKDMGAIPSRWKGICMEGTNFSSSNCNKKLIGARYYPIDEDTDVLIDRTESDSPRDMLGHGTHTSSTAAGNLVRNAAYYGLASGSAKGGSTTSRIAMYKVCSFGCTGSAILAGFDDAIADGVDILSLSIGASGGYKPDFAEDPIAIGAFHAVAKGILVVCSAGNSGPVSGSVVNVAPWILTVAATTIDRYFESDLVLGGDNKAIKGEAINFSKLEKSPVYPLITGEAAKSNSSSNAGLASHCEPDELDKTRLKGKIVLCKHQINDTFKQTKVASLKNSGAIGAIFINDLEKAAATTYISLPVTEITSEVADEILTYINSTKEPVATILPTITVNKYKPAPQVAYFSSRGPSSQTSSILKPDVAAPGVTILASWIPNDGSSDVPEGQKPSPFNIASGTSMSCPHVAGTAAAIKSWNPTWSPAAIRSAIMTTATHMDNDKAPMTTDSGSTATPFDYGAGEVSPSGALTPGLVYEVDMQDYLQFLCNYGYTSSEIKLITTIPEGFECSKNSSRDLISELNYPSIAISNFSRKGARTVTRTVTSIGDQEDNTYVVNINSPPELDVRVVPNKLHFTKNIKKLSYQVTFSPLSSTLNDHVFGSITWSDGTHRVTSPYVVSQ